MAKKIVKTVTKQANKQSVIITRVPSELKQKLQKLADNDNRKLGDYVRLTLSRHVESTKTKK
jgi:predicted DNA-binding protein